MEPSPLPQLHFSRMCRWVTSWVCFRIKDLFQYVLDAAFNWQWQDSAQPCSYSCNSLFCLLLSDRAPAAISAPDETVVLRFYSIRKGVSLHMCCFHLHCKQGWMCKGTMDTGIYLAVHGRALFQWKWLCPTPRFCKCRIKQCVMSTSASPHSSDPSLSLYIFIPPLWILPLPYITF